MERRKKGERRKLIQRLLTRISLIILACFAIIFITLIAVYRENQKIREGKENFYLCLVLICSAYWSADLNGANIFGFVGNFLYEKNKWQTL